MFINNVFKIMYGFGVHLSRKYVVFVRLQKSMTVKRNNLFCMFVLCFWTAMLLSELI